MYVVCPGELLHYFQYFVDEAGEVKAKPAGLAVPLDYGAIMGLKASDRRQTEFTAESHVAKLSGLWQKFGKHV